MTARLGQWSLKLKFSALVLVLFFVLSNFTFLWLSYSAKTALKDELKVKLEGLSLQLARRAGGGAGVMGHRLEIQEFLSDNGLLAFGFFGPGPKPEILTRGGDAVSFAADFHPENAAALSGPISFGGRFTCTYSFPARMEAGKKLPAGFVIAPADQLGRLEKLFRLETYFWLVGFLLMAAAATLLWRFVLAPFETAVKKAAEARLGPTETGPNADPAAATLESFEMAIAELKAKEQELSRLYRESEKRAGHYSALSRHLIESLTSGIVIFNPEGKVADFNPAAERLLHLEDTGRLPETLARLVAGTGPGQPAGFTELRLEILGERKILAASASVISNPAGEVLGRALLVSDLTGFKEMERKLKEQEHWAFLGETAAGLAHELRNALAVMVGYGKLLAKAVGETHPSHRTAERLLKESRAAEETLKRFLEYARPGEVFWETVDPAAILSELTATLESQFPKVKFECRAPGEFCRRSDSTLLKQIFSNLLRNAAEAAGRGGWVKVTLEAWGRSPGWRLEVADSGPGVPAGQKEKIFSPFFTTRPEGTGLGLALVKKAVHLLEGEIQLLETEKGAVFAVTFPERLRALTEKDEVQVEHHVRR